jgi:hypothetical protein
MYAKIGCKVPFLEVPILKEQRFKALIARSGSRVFIAVPFNPNDVWGSKQRHSIRGSVNSCGVRGSLGSDGTQFFLALGAAWRRDSGLDVGIELLKAEKRQK